MTTFDSHNFFAAEEEGLLNLYNVLMVKEVWIVGMYDTLMKRGVVEYVEFRDAETLTELVRKYVAPGTTVFTDQWRGYCRLRAAGYDHQTVTYSPGKWRLSVFIRASLLFRAQLNPGARCIQSNAVS